MIELKKQNVHMNQLKLQKTTQISVDEDVILPEVKPDMTTLIVNQGDVEITSATSQTGKLLIKGKLLYSFLYNGPEGLHSVQGECILEDTINLEGASQGDSISLDWDLEDLQIAPVNERKYSVKAVITLQIAMEQLTDQETATDLTQTDLEYEKKPLEVTEIVVQKKDIYRIKDEIELGENKPDIGQILWESVTVQGLENRLLADQIAVSGELVVFIMYQPSGIRLPMQWLETTIPFRGMIEVDGCSEEMIPQIAVRLGHKQIEPKADNDGELRIFSLDAVLDLDIKIYQEIHIEILSDLYSTKQLVEPVRQDGHYESLLVKNGSKCKLQKRLSVAEEAVQIMQICNVKGIPKVEEITVVEDGLQVEGILAATVLYISGNDENPLQSVEKIIPFSYTITVPGIAKDSVYFLHPGMESITANMISMDEMEIRGVVSLDTLVFSQVTEAVITDVTQWEFDLEQMEELPCIVGHRVQGGESLWEIAKANFTKIKTIMEINGLTSEKVEPGQKIIIVKEAYSMVK
jgi:hypothetical protein